MRKEHKLASRKLWFSIATSVAIFIGGMIAAFMPSFGVTYPELIAGLLGVLTIYSGANVGAGILARPRKKPEPEPDGPPVEQ